ncbi:MAG TPA: carboxypeptidase regulatory-like domain-containing protein, partial [Labilithrix sp.]|nr:carboxypeptidase regulatory-like domain-containing protein [Labilithrix sp.]
MRGVAKLTARASRDQSALGGSELVFGGTLVDDAGQPLAQQVVTIRITHETLPNDPRLLEALKMPRGCQQSGDDQLAASVRPGGANEIVATTDDEGRFCFRARIDPDRYRATVAYAPSATHSLVDGVQRELAFDLSRRNLALHFDPTPKVIGLDTPRTTIDAIALVDDDATPQVAQRLPLVLSNEKGELARTATDASGRAHFAVSSRELGPPGPGTLHLSFPGDGETARATLSQEIERHVKVAVTVPAAERGELSAAIPEDGIPLTAEVASSFGPITEGSVEARIGEVVVGAAPVEHGIARLTLTFSGQGTEALVSLRYVPASPWYEPLGPRTILVPIRGPNLLSKAPILLAGLVVLAFFLLGRVSGQRSKPEPLPSKPARDSREAKPRIDVVQPALVGQKGWTGRVVDAHEGTPVRGARVWIERGTFEGREVLASTETDADGRFSLRDVETVAGGATITAEARLHSRLSQDLPARGDILIALADRR